MYCIKKNERNTIICKIINYLHHYSDDVCLGNGYYPRMKDTKIRGVKAFEEILKHIKDKLNWNITLDKLKTEAAIFKAFKKNKSCYCIEKDRFFEIHEISENDFIKLELTMYNEVEDKENINKQNLSIIKEFIEEYKLSINEKLDLIHHLSMVFLPRKPTDDE